MHFVHRGKVNNYVKTINLKNILKSTGLKINSVKVCVPEMKIKKDTKQIFEERKYSYIEI